MSRPAFHGIDSTVQSNPCRCEQADRILCQQREGRIIIVYAATAGYGLWIPALRLVLGLGPNRVEASQQATDLDLQHDFHTDWTPADVQGLNASG